MTTQALAGKKIAVVVESEFVPMELEAYRQQFTELGAEVHFMSRLWDQPSLTFVSDVTEEGALPETVTIERDFQTVELDDYAAVIMAANYTSVKLRWLTDEDNGDNPITRTSGRNAPAVQFFYRAMMNPRIIKGFPCHGLWILTPIPEVLAGRRVTCNRVMLGDVYNAGGLYVDSGAGVRDVKHDNNSYRVVVDADMVTSDSASNPAVNAAFVEAVRDQIVAMKRGEVEPAITAATTPSASRFTEPVVAAPTQRRILMVVSEWGYWGEELIGPLEEFDRHGYETVICTPTGKRPNAILVSKLAPADYEKYKGRRASGKDYEPPSAPYLDPPLGRSVTTFEMAVKVAELDDPDTDAGKRLENPLSLTSWFPERPYWADPQFVRFMEIYHHRLELAEASLEEYDAMILVGGSGPIVDMVNNQRVHDLILGFYKAGKPIAAECYGVACLAFARNIEDRLPIIRGKRVTGHCLEYDYKDGTGFMQARDEFLDFNMGPPPYPLEYILRDAAGPDGAFIGNFGHPTSVIVDYPFITGRSTPDSYLTGRKLIETLDGEPPLRRWGW